MGLLKFKFRRLYFLKGTMVPIDLEVGWAPESVWTIFKREKFLTNAEIRNQNNTVRTLVTIQTTLSSVSFYVTTRNHTNMGVIFVIMVTRT
jgi:hypothetical protein